MALAVGPEAEPAGAAVEHHAEQRRRVEARHAHPLDHPVGRDQRARMTVREEGVVRDRREGRAPRARVGQGERVVRDVGHVASMTGPAEGRGLIAPERRAVPVLRSAGVQPKERGTMATAARTLRNFIDGELVDPARRRVASPSSTPPPASRSQGARVRRGRRRPRRGRRAPRLRRLGEHDARRALARAAAPGRQRSRQHADELAELEADRTPASRSRPSRTTRSPSWSTTCASSPAPRGCLEGNAAGEYLEGYTSMIRREPIGVVGQIAPVELPADDGRLEDRPSARGREHRRAQAGARRRP